MPGLSIAHIGGGVKDEYEAMMEQWLVGENRESLEKNLLQFHFSMEKPCQTAFTARLVVRLYEEKLDTRAQQADLIIL
jgi:hypothetical protein